jgi:hypothetical protein
MAMLRATVANETVWKVEGWGAKVVARTTCMLKTREIADAMVRPKNLIAKLSCKLGKEVAPTRTVKPAM